MALHSLSSRLYLSATHPPWMNYGTVSGPACLGPATLSHCCAAPPQPSTPDQHHAMAVHQLPVTAPSISKVLLVPLYPVADMVTAIPGLLLTVLTAPHPSPTPDNLPLSQPACASASQPVHQQRQYKHQQRRHHSAASKALPPAAELLAVHRLMLQRTTRQHLAPALRPPHQICRVQR